MGSCASASRLRRGCGRHRAPSQRRKRSRRGGDRRQLRTRRRRRSRPGVRAGASGGSRRPRRMAHGGPDEGLVARQDRKEGDEGGLHPQGVVAGGGCERERTPERKRSVLGVEEKEGAKEAHGVGGVGRRGEERERRGEPRRPRPRALRAPAQGAAQRDSGERLRRRLHDLRRKRARRGGARRPRQPRDAAARLYGRGECRRRLRRARGRRHERRPRTEREATRERR